MSGARLIDRSFARLAEGLVHYRHAGDLGGAARPLFMAHAGPGSSRGIEPLMEALSEDIALIAWDMPGNGDSCPPAAAPTDIPYYADAIVRLLDRLGVEKVDFYGSHTGAFIGTEMALMHPDRIARLVLDGVMFLDDAQRASMLANYAPEVTPDDHGGHLSWAHMFLRDMMIFYPYFERDAEHRTHGSLPPPEAMHAGVVDVLKALGTYHHAYRAAFAYRAEERLPQLTLPVMLMCSMRDPLYADLERAGAMLPDAPLHLLPVTSGAAEKAHVIEQFLAEG